MILSWVVIFLLIAVIAGFFGFSGVAKESTMIAKGLFVLFLVLFILAFAREQGWIDTNFELFSFNQRSKKI